MDGHFTFVPHSSRRSVPHSSRQSLHRADVGEHVLDEAVHLDAQLRVRQENGAEKRAEVLRERIFVMNLDVLLR